MSLQLVKSKFVMSACEQMGSGPFKPSVVSLMRCKFDQLLCRLLDSPGCNATGRLSTKQRKAFMLDQASAACCIAAATPKCSPWRESQIREVSARLALYPASSPSLRAPQGDGGLEVLER